MINEMSFLIIYFKILKMMKWKKKKKIQLIILNNILKLNKINFLIKYKSKKLLDIYIYKYLIVY